MGMRFIISLLLLTATVVAQTTFNNLTVKTNLTVQSGTLNMSGNRITNLGRGSLSTDAVNLSQANVPLLSTIPSGITNYWALGDSQTYGEFALVYDFTDGAKRMYPVFRYANILASKYGLNLTNQAVSGSRIAYTVSSPANTLAQANVIPASWSGLVTVMAGYNDAISDNYGNSMRTLALFRSAGNAVIARLLAEDWINPDGLNSSGVAVGTYSSSGGVVSDGGNAGLSPFPAGSPATDTRRLLTMTAGNTVTFSATNPVVWVQTRAVGGTIQLWQGTNQIAGLDTDTIDSATFSLPQAMTGLGLSGSFTVTNVAGTNVLLAVGAIMDASDVAGRSVIIAPPVRLKSSTRIDGVAAAIGNALRSAVQDWTGYQVGYADVASKMDLSTMIPSGDQNHPNPFGHKAFAQAFDNAVRLDAVPTAGAPSPRYTDQSFQVYGIPSSTSQYEPTVSIISSVTGSVGYIDSYLPPSGPFYPLTIRTKRAHFAPGHLSVGAAPSALSDYEVSNQVAISMGGGVGYVQSFNYNGATVTYLPLYLLGSETRIANGSFRVGAAGTSFTIMQHGTAVLVGGTVAVANTSVTANSRILLTSQVDGGTPGFLRISARSAGVSFTITSSSGTDTSTVAWALIEP